MRFDDAEEWGHLFARLMRVFTNDVATVNALARADARLQAVAWEDPLTFGRLAPGRDLATFAVDRAAVYDAAHWNEDRVVEQDLRLRAEALEASLASGVEICLLFGASLLDQLQLAQILAWAETRSEQERQCLRLMVVDGPISIFDDGALLEVAKEGASIHEATFEAYGRAWDAVTAPDPASVEAVWKGLSNGDHLSLCSALERWLKELPSEENGLSVTQMQVLDTVRLGIGFPQEVFEAVQETEAIPFRINWEFWQILAGLASGEDPLLEVAGSDSFLCPPKVLAWTPFHDQRLQLTERGRAILKGEQHFARGEFASRWLGGARIDGSSRWFWSFGRGEIVNEPLTGTRAERSQTV